MLAGIGRLPRPMLGLRALALLKKCRNMRDNVLQLNSVRGFNLIVSSAPYIQAGTVLPGALLAAALLPALDQAERPGCHDANIVGGSVREASRVRVPRDEGCSGCQDCRITHQYQCQNRLCWGTQRKVSVLQTVPGAARQRPDNN